VIPSVVNASLNHRVTEDIFTVLCVSHFAFPPVNLVWVKGQSGVFCLPISAS